MNKVRAAIFVCVTTLAVGAFAVQYPAGSQPSQPQQPQGAMQPGQQPGQQPGTPAPPNPGAMRPDENQPSGGQAQQPNAQAAHGPSIDDQVQALAQQLNLTPDQQTKVKAALQDQHAQAVTIIQDNSLAREDKIQKIHALRQSTITKVRATLTSDDQKSKFDQMVQAQDDRMRQHEQPQQAQPTTPPKQ